MTREAHEHRCAHCLGSFTCDLDCDDMQDGEPTCASCATARFDAIVPQERMVEPHWSRSYSWWKRLRGRV